MSQLWQLCDIRIHYMFWLTRPSSCSCIYKNTDKLYSINKTHEKKPEIILFYRNVSSSRVF